MSITSLEFGRQYYKDMTINFKSKNGLSVSRHLNIDKVGRLQEQLDNMIACATRILNHKRLNPRDTHSDRALQIKEQRIYSLERQIQNINGTPKIIYRRYKLEILR